MRKRMLVWGCAVLMLGASSVAWAAYHHEGESDAANVLSVYPEIKGTKLDHCALCHCGGETTNSKGKTMTMGSCQWCHDYTEYGKKEDAVIAATLNVYGQAYDREGENIAAVRAIKDDDLDGDGFTNDEEITQGHFPGNKADYPGLKAAPYRIYTRAQLEAMGAHTQFLLMNTSRSGDFYAEYTGVPMETLLEDAGVLDSADYAKVYAPDGWSQGHPLDYIDDSLNVDYHLRGMVSGLDVQYPEGTYHYNTDADIAVTPSIGWCDYSAPSCVGRKDGASISVDGGLKAILAYKREGAYLTPGVLNDENKLDGEGPFRLVVPQKADGAPDQSSKSDDQGVYWPYDEDGLDHNAGACTRSATIIKVEPLPVGTTDIDILEAGWDYVGQNKVIVYGAIDGTDTNGNGVLDSEEKAGGQGDMDGDGILDYEDEDTSVYRHTKGDAVVKMHTSQGALKQIKPLSENDPGLPSSGKPAGAFPYGLADFYVTGLTNGASVTLTIEYPKTLPSDAIFYKVVGGAWKETPFRWLTRGRSIELTLTDGDPETDADGEVNGEIRDPGGITTEGTDSESSNSSSCFIQALIF
jgi:hypothetical protein